MPTSPELNFDTSNLSSFDLEAAEQLLQEQPELYKNHLLIASYLEQYAGRIRDTASSLPGSRELNEGYADGMTDIAAHLRQGDFVEGGVLLREV
jgi:hypothetical protein